MSLEILTYPHPVLARKADPIPTITPDLAALVADMAETMYQNKGIGLAAPQIGRSIQLVIIDLSGPEQRTGLTPLINPVITHKEGLVESDEGCLSLPHLRGVVSRAERVQVQAKDLEGKEVTIDADGLLAICLQHELDHLNGRLLLDRVSRLKRSLYDKKVSKWLKRRHDG